MSSDAIPHPGSSDALPHPGSSDASKSGPRGALLDVLEKLDKLGVKVIAIPKTKHLMTPLVMSRRSRASRVAIR